MKSKQLLNSADVGEHTPASPPTDKLLMVQKQAPGHGAAIFQDDCHDVAASGGRRQSNRGPA